MNHTTLTCDQALAAIEHDPLTLDPPVLSHLDACPACAEARVMWLAQEDVAPALVPAGYFETLPRRIARKLPPQRRRLSRASLWAAAVGLALVAGSAGGYLAGRANRVAVVEATAAPRTTETLETLPDAPFAEGDESLSKLNQLSPEESKALVERLKNKSR